MFGHWHRQEWRERAYRLLADVDLAGREPTGNLDSASVERVVALIQRLRRGRADLTVIMVTRDARVATAADRTVHMSDGRIVQAALAG